MKEILLIIRFLSKIFLILMLAVRRRLCMHSNITNERAGNFSFIEFRISCFFRQKYAATSVLLFFKGFSKRLTLGFMGGVVSTHVLIMHKTSESYTTKALVDQYAFKAVILTMVLKNCYRFCKYFLRMAALHYFT